MALSLSFGKIESTKVIEVCDKAQAIIEKFVKDCKTKQDAIINLKLDKMNKDAFWRKLFGLKLYTYNDAVKRLRKESKHDLRIYEYWQELSLIYKMKTTAMDSQCVFVNIDEWRKITEVLSCTN